MKKESKTIQITDLNGKTWNEEIMVNPEFPTYAIEMRGIDIGHKFYTGPVGAERNEDGIFEVREYRIFSEADQLNGNGKAGRKLAEIEVL